MTTEWEFLEPWCTVLRRSWMRENTHAPESALKVSFVVPVKHPITHEKSIYLKLPGNERNRQDTGRLQQLREAMELFTLLSFVNNEEFQELLFAPTALQSDCSLRWKIRLVGNLSSSNAAVAQNQVTWGAFLGFPDDPWEYSPEYRAAVQKLEAMRVEESTEACSYSTPTILWTCRLLNMHVKSGQGADNSADVSRSFRVQLRRLFDTVVPHIVRAFATRGGATLVNTCIPGKQTCTTMTATIRNWDRPAVPELTVALARTATTGFELELEGATINSRYAMMKAGFLLNTLVCGKALRLVTSNYREFSRDTSPVNFGKLTLRYLKVCNRMFSSVCSAVAESSTEVRLSCHSVRSDRWSWLVYALCCGSLDALTTKATIAIGELTKSDIVTISAVLQTHYPQPILDSNDVGSHAYGFVDIQEGTELYPRVGYRGNDSGFVLSSGCRCRALYDPNESVSLVNFVLPGYGICKAKLGEGVIFTPDSEKPVFPEKRLCGSLALYHVTFETSAVLMELLTQVTHGLRPLELYVEEEVATTSIHIDLSALSTACPELQHLCITKFNVVVSAHNESLRRWPIKTIIMQGSTGPLSDLTRCFRNPTLRMAQELVEIKVITRRNVFDEEEMRDFNSFNGEFLPITKEKFPAKSKAAMLSVVTSASCTTKPIHHLDTGILGLIFTFSSIPEQRLVKCWCQCRISSC